MKFKSAEDTINAYLKAWQEKAVVIRPKRNRRAIKPGTNRCLFCKELITGHKRNYCSNLCWRNATKAEYHKNKKLKVTEERVCAHCNNKFIALRDIQIYCTSSCRQEKWNELHREKYRIAFGLTEEK